MLSSPRSKTIQIDFQTTKFAPNYTVTLRCPAFLGDAVISGEYSNAAWHFELPIPANAATVLVRFYLNSETQMDGQEIEIATGTQQHVFDETAIRFSNYSSRYVHGIEGLVTETTDFTRRFCPGNVDTSKTYDVIVIGSGMGGGILADQLSDRGLDVLCLEVGTVHYPAQVENLPIPSQLRTSASFENEPGSVLTRDVCLNLGGRSVYWSAVIPRMNSWDLAHWPRDIVRYLELDGYSRAERVFRKRTEFDEFEKFLRARIEDTCPECAVGHLPRSFHQETSWITARRGSPDERPTGFFSTASLLLNSLSYPGATGSDHLTVNLNHLVTKIESSGRGVTGVVAQDLVGNCERVYRAKHVVLAAGATESPSIFLRSGLTDHSGKVGVGLTDHQSAELGFEIPPTSAVIAPFDTAKMLLLPRSDFMGNSQFSCELALNWRFWDARYEDDDLWQSRIGDSAPMRSTIKFLFRRPLNERNWVRNAVGKSRVFVEPMLDKPFEAEANNLKEKLLSFLGVTDPNVLHSPLVYREQSETFHTGGSLRIGNHRHGVVNTDLKFHEYDNLYCCDLSVFPDIPTANPSLTLGALALRLADHIAQLEGQTPNNNDPASGGRLKSLMDVAIQQ